MNGQTISVPHISLPQGGGAIKGIGETFEAAPFSGTANLSIPVYASPARGLMPEVSLGYSSASGNGVFGVGFSLTLPSISRRTETRIPRYDDTDTFILPGGINLVVAARVGDAASQRVKAERRVREAEDGASWTVTDYLPQLEGSFPKIEFWVRDDGAAYESYWKVVSGENVTSIYGRTENARIADPRDRSRVFQWLIEESRDALGNKVAYSYKQENDENTPEEIYENGRAYGANRYVQSIKYGNYFYEDDTGARQEAFAFEMVFDYGEYDLDNPELPVRPWEARKDPFSSYRAGFEIRTCRLCKAVLMFHRFAGEADGRRFVVRATRFEYEQTPVMSFLKGVQAVGYRQEGDGPPQVQRTPPARFAYTQFEPARQSFEPLVVRGGGEVSGYLAAGQYMLIDLYGEGIPGFLHSGEAATLYWKPAGGGEYGFPEPPVEFPIERSLSLARHSLQDVNGNGRLDLVVSYPGRGGYYKNNDDGTWEPYANFPSYPNGSPHPAQEVVDLNGDGLADILLIEDKYVNYYPSAGGKGYGPLVRKLRQNGVAVTSKDYAGEFVGFAGLFGDGLSHRVRVRSGIVECWPDLGHGQFGNRVLFGNAPTFDGGLDASRLFFADLNGSGAEDLIYVDVDHVKVFVNQGGNAFADPIAIPLPVSYQSIDQVSFGDVLGQGAASLILTVIEPEVSHLYYDFVGRTKPYLLNHLDNGLGATTAVEYKASTEYYLRDRRDGRPWKTKLPFPVQVVSKVESLDRISGSKSSALYSYHDGYYDPYAKEYRGFGLVERWDTETFDVFSQPGLHHGVNFNAGQPELHTAPVYTKTWYHTGARAEGQTLSRQYGGEYFNKDAGAHELPDSAFDPAIYLSGEPTILQAYAALTGRVLREEVYGLDGQPGVSENPYTVTESNYYVRLIQPAQSASGHAVFLVFDTERIAYNYERNLADPRVSHNFNLAVDEFGNITESCAIYYPRRTPADGAADPVEKVYPEQSTLKAVAQLNLFINAVDGHRLLGVPCEGRSFEVGGLNLPAGNYFTFAEVKAAVAEALRDQVPYGQPFAPGRLQARTFSWQRTYYWNEEQTAALPLQAISPRALWHHTETAEFPPQYVEDVFGGRVGPALLEADGNYFLGDGYWWNPGLTLFYYSRPDSFYLPRQSLSACGVVTSVDYDQYWLLPVREAELVSDDGAEPQENVTTAVNDYYTLQPKQTSDINGVVAQALYDPLGFTTVTSIHKTDEGVSVGDGDLAGYRRRPHPTFDEVIANPHYYLEDATTYFYHDPFAWTRDGQPACSVSLARETHVSDLPPDTESRIRIQIVYSDGFAREIETRDNAEPGAATPALKRPPSDRSPEVQAASGPWVVSGQTVYNNKSLPVEEYLPRYSLSPHYEPQGQSVEQGLLPPPTRTHYDPLLRVIRVDTPKGFFTKAEITAWAVRRFDEDDTVKDSAYYKEHINDDRPEFRDEREALEKAAVFYDTPEQSAFDNMGRVFLVVQTNARRLGDAVEYSLLETSSELDIQSNVLSMTDPRGVLGLTQSFSMNGGVLSTQSADAGLRLNLENADDNTVHAWDNRGFHAATSYDRLQRPSAIRVEGDDGRGLALDQVVERIVYGESQPDSFERNRRGQVYEWYDQAGVVRYDLYGIEGQLLKTVRQLRADYKNEANWDDPADVALEPERYETAYAYDALGNLTSERTPDGSDYRAQYIISGGLKRVEVIFPEGGSRTFVEGIEYDAAGQRQRISYGDGVVTRLSYEGTTLRLSNIYTTRPAAERKGQSASPTLQDIAYTYDPVGNLTTTSDRSQETVFCAQQQVEPRSGYTYDAVYRLVEATGRQHPGIGAETHVYGFKQTLYMQLCPPHTNDGDKLQNYKETYTYDASGNLTELRHIAPPSSPSWTRTLAVPADSNRGVPSDSPDTRYDANGNMLELQNLRRLAWDCRNNISQADVILREEGNSDSDYFVYDYEGSRVRKVVERMAHGGSVTQIQETIYLGNLVIYRTKQQSAAGTATTLERQSLHVMDDGETCVAITNYWPQDDFKRETATPGTRQFRFQLPDILGSSCVEVDQSANVISYEEYFPYGGTSVIAGDDAGEVALKDYRYSGKECDDSTGLYYYGARYYAAWLGRWLSPDPAGPLDSLNLYVFVANNPVSNFDIGGTVTCSVCGQAGHNKANKTFHPVQANVPPVQQVQPQVQQAQPQVQPVQQAQPPPLVSSADILKKHTKHHQALKLTVPKQGSKGVLRGGKFVKVYTKKSKHGGTNVYIYANRKALRAKYSQSTADFMELELERKYTEANRLIAANLETATIGSAIHEPTSSQHFVKNQWQVVHGNLTNIPKNPSGSVDIRGVGQALNPIPNNLLDHHGQPLRQDVDERVSRDFGGSGSDPNSTLKPTTVGQNQWFMESYSNSLAGSADTAIKAHATIVKTNKTKVRKFKLVRSSSFTKLT